MKVKDLNTDSEEEEEEQMNVERDLEDGFVGPAGVAGISLFKPCLALQRWREVSMFGKTHTDALYQHGK